MLRRILLQIVSALGRVNRIFYANESFEDWKKRGHDHNSIYAAPMFVDPDNYDFRLKPESPALRRGFEPINLSGVPGINPPATGP